MATKLQQIFAAAIQSFYKREPGNATSAPFAFPATIKPDDNRRSMKLLRQAGRHNPDDAWMPPRCSDHNRKITVRQKRSRDLLQDFVERPLFERLPVTVLPFEAPRQ